jgi:hypothetical protein
VRAHVARTGVGEGRDELRHPDGFLPPTLIPRSRATNDGMPIEHDPTSELRQQRPRVLDVHAVPASRSTVSGRSSSRIDESATPASGITTVGSSRRARSVSSDRAAPAICGSSSSWPMKRMPVATSRWTPASAGRGSPSRTRNSHRGRRAASAAREVGARSTRSCRRSSGR